MRRLLVFAFILLFVLSSLFFKIEKASSDELDEINKQINELTQALNMSIKATQPLESQLQSMQKQITDIKSRVLLIESDIAAKRKNIDEGYKNLERQEKILARTIRGFYIKSYYSSPFLVFLSSASASEITRTLAYQKAAADQDKAIITNIALSIVDLEVKKENLEAEQARLTSIKKDLDEQSAKLNEVVSGAKAYQQTLSGQIAQLTAKQQTILQQRSGSFTVTIGDSELADDYNASIKGFREQAPAGSFAVFSFGGHTHRKGMSQYGARGRAESGQNYRDILRAYYGKEPVSKDTGGDILVQSQGSINFEERYLYGIAEMPSAWNMEALKAQAVAARTYAYRYKQEGKEICTSEACQVFLSSKADTVSSDPNHPWGQAVRDTRGQVIEDVVTYYASTHGVYITTMGWDTTDSGGGSNFVDKSYEKKGGSPWVYKAWYTKGYSPSSDKCGRSNPWLNGTELADIVNAALVLSKGSSEETERITPVTTSCWGGNPYNHEELRAVASKYGGITNASSVSVSQGNGTTNTVAVNGISISGSDFKRAFNLRAPGYLSVPQFGFAFFNIEAK